MKKNLLIGFFVSIILLSGCSSSVSDKPPDIMAGKDPCDNCFMIINENKYAGALWLDNGEAKRFDDIGCMMSYVKKNNSKVSSYWVYDYLSGNPLKADKALFLFSDSFETPMGSGVIAVQSQSEVSQLTGKYKAEIISFNDLKNKYNKSKMEQ
jgi:copper chaperone NosL